MVTPHLDTVLFPDRPRLQAIAWHLGDHVNAKSLHTDELMLVDEFYPVGGGQAIVFRFGAMVTIDVDPDAAAHLREAVLKHTTNGQPASEKEEAQLAVVTDLDLSGPRSSIRFSTEEGIPIPRATAGHLHIIAEVLAKSAALAYYEGQVSQVFERIEPLARTIQKGQRRSGAQELLRLLGDATQAQMGTTGRMEVRDKPQLAWDRTDLDRLWGALMDEYEIVERDALLSRKLELISSSTSTYYQLLQSHQTHRVEWYIVILILVEIVLIVYEILVR